MHLYKLTTSRGKLRSLPGTLTFIQPGDVLMLTSKIDLTQAQMTTSQRGMKRIFPGHDIIILGKDTTFRAVRPAATPPDPQQLRDSGLLTPGQ